MARTDGELRAFSPSAGEDMSADGRRQLALFLVSSGAGWGKACRERLTRSSCRVQGAGCWLAGWLGGSKGKLPGTYLPCLSPQARKHLHNFEATHCTPLPAQHFQMPWHL